MRWAALALLCFLVPAAAQEEDAPRLTADFEKTETIPGQALSLRLTVLVPTYMPRPPVWPTFETPNLLVRVASTGPTSQRIGGATWAGVSRRYLVTPMVPGEVTLPPATVAITYADPATNAPVTATLEAGPFAVTGIVPEGAAGLDPFVAADGLVLEQTLDGDPSAMVPGDSVVRTVTATIRGTPPMFLPPLIAASPVEGVRAYPDEPVLAETSGRGVVSGTRTERVTYVAEGGGAGEIPAVTLDWYDLGSGEITTAAVDGFAIAVDGPPAAGAMAEPRDLRMMALWGAAVLLLLAALALLVRRIVPPLRRLLAARRSAWLASEAHAFHELSDIVRRHDHRRLRPALDEWAGRVATGDPRRDPRLAAALEALGRARYGTRPIDEAAAWQQLGAALANGRRLSASHGKAAVLPPLNPVAR